MNYSAAEIWTIIIALGIGTFAIRFSFLGPFGRTKLPLWALRLLRYTPVAVLPGLVAPLILWPGATGGDTDPARLIAALVTLALGAWSKNVVLAITGGGAALYLVLYLTG
ncbi:MAG: AzlD domain-containing protein [Paracoccaceae bacterium]